MKNKFKIFLIILSIFFFVGCTPKVTYIISDDKITENVEIKFNGDYTKEKIEQTLDYYSYRGSFKADINVKSVQEGYVGTVTSPELLVEDYFRNNATLINECYEYVEFSHKNKKFYINTSVGFQCLVYDYNVVDELSITIRTSNKVYEHNADKKGNNEYTWYITRDNAENQSILFVVEDKQYVWYDNYKFLFVGIIVVLMLALTTAIVISTFKNVSKKVNRI